MFLKLECVGARGNFVCHLTERFSHRWETESWQDEKTWLQYTQLGGVGVVADLLELFPFCLLSSLLCSLGTKSTSLLLI